MLRLEDVAGEMGAVPCGKEELGSFSELFLSVMNCGLRSLCVYRWGIVGLMHLGCLGWLGWLMRWWGSFHHRPFVEHFLVNKHGGTIEPLKAESLALNAAKISQVSSPLCPF